MQTYLILRRGAWASSEEFESAVARSGQVVNEDMADRIRWIRSYVLDEEDGTLGTVCVYQAEDEDDIMEHAQRAELPADEVILVSETVLMSDDP